MTMTTSSENQQRVESFLEWFRALEGHDQELVHEMEGTTTEDPRRSWGGAIVDAT